MGEGYAAKQRWGGLPVVGGGGGSLMTHSAVFVTSQSIAKKICDGFLTIQVLLIFKTGHGRFAIH